MESKLYGPGYDDAVEIEMPKWLAKAIDKNQAILAVDLAGKYIPLSTFKGADDRNIVEHAGKYYIKVKSDVAYFSRIAREAGFQL